MQFFHHAGFMLELLITAAFYTGSLEKRKNAPISSVLSAVCAICIAWGWSTFFTTSAVWSTILRSFIFYVLCFVVMWITFKLTWKQTLFFVAGTVALQHACYSCSQIVIITLPQVKSAFVPLHADWLMYPVLFCIFLSLGYVLFIRPIQGKLPDNIGSTFIVGAVGIMLCVTVFSSLFDSYIEHTRIANDAYFMLVLTRLVTCIFLLMLLREITERETAQRDREFLQQLLSQQRRKLENDKETIDLINIKTHDLKKQLAVLGNRVSKDEIDELTNLVSIYDSTIHTGNDTLDVLIANKALICEQRGIQFDRIIDGSCLSFMKEADIYSLFGNAIDNAMDAVTKIEDRNKRYIRMKVTQARGMLVIHAENPFVGNISFEQGIPQTTKTDKRYHGFGMKSMRLLTERYSGVMSVKAENGVFTLNILIPLVQK